MTYLAHDGDAQIGRVHRMVLCEEIGARKW